MGTEIELTIGGIAIDYAKNNRGVDHGSLFQDCDRTRRQAEGFDYDTGNEAEDEDRLSRGEACFVRSLSRVLPRLELLGDTLDVARHEYVEVVEAEIEYSSYAGGQAKDKSDFMSFDEYVEFCGRYQISALDDAYIDWHRENREVLCQGRFAGMDEFKRLPQVESNNMFWSERTFFGSQVRILSAYSMLQVFGQSERNSEAEVVWQFGPLVEAGWASAEDFHPGARRSDAILVATEGTSDARVLRRAIDVLRPDIKDFFRFIDVDQGHPFPGTGNLVKFAQGLVQIDVQNRLLFVVDNDAEGLSAFRRIEAMQKPSNMRVMMLPDLQEFQQFPARGPEGSRDSDINGRAVAIECYLDLRLQARAAPEVVWTNYKSDLGVWQGALEHKDTYTRHFLEQDERSLRDASYDTRKLEVVLDALVAEAAETAGR